MRWRRRKRPEDLERELRDHLELEAEERHEAGVSPDEARYAARRRLGNTTLIKEDVRAVWTWTLLEQIGQDLRYAARTMRKTRGGLHGRDPVPCARHRRQHGNLRP